MAQIQAMISSLDVVPTTTASPAPPRIVDVVRVDYGTPKIIARNVASILKNLRVNVAGASIVISGSAEDVEQGKRLIESLDHPSIAIRYSVLFHPRYYNVTSIVALLRRTFKQADFAIQENANAFTVTADAADQRRIRDAVAQIDIDATGGANTAAGPGFQGASGSNIEIYTLHAALPGVNGSPSNSAAELAAIVQQALGTTAADLHITIVPNAQKLILAGTPYSISAARDLLKKLDVIQSLVVLDTQIVEVDNTVATDLGLSLPQPVISDSFSETSPTSDATGITPRLIGLQPLQRTPLSLTAQLSLLVQHGKARVLANPHITTLSGHTATIRAGDTISVQTTAGGGAGTVATTQLQTFQTGVSLDITPQVNADNFVTVTLHPTVNSEIGILNGIPQIATRDTETTVALRENQTLVIGGLIQESNSETINKIPLLGDIPLLGHLFSEHQVNSSRNDLIITVTPHIINPDGTRDSSGPVGLPALPAGTTLDSSADNRIPNPYLAPTSAPSLGQPERAASTPQPIASPAPAPLSSAGPMASVNTFTYGNVPQNNFAKPSDPVQIFYIHLNPTVLKKDDVATIDVVTTTNATNVAFQQANASQTLMMTAPGQWQGKIILSKLSTSLPPAPANIPFTLTAQQPNGSIASVPFTLSLLP